MLSTLFNLTTMNAQNELTKLIVEKLPESINSPDYDEISPVVSRDGTRLYFTRTGSPEYNRSLLIDGTDARDSLNSADYERLLRLVYRKIGGYTSQEIWKSKFNQDIWIADFSKRNELLKVHHPSEPLNNALPNALATIMPEPGHYIVMNQFPKKGGMSKGFSHIYHNGQSNWSWPMPIEIDNYYTHSDGVGLTMSEDGDVMILSLNRRDGYGKTDLYYSQRIDSTHWSEPVNLGKGINSEFRESTPSLSEDKRTLYFSSNRYGRGGNDIYFCTRLDSTWTNWSLARRFREPISSSSDDSQPQFNNATGYLYFTSNRDGSSDIYRVKVQKPQPVEILISGTVINGITKESMDADVFVKTAGGDGLDTTMITKDGRFSFKVNTLNDLLISPEKKGFIGHVERLKLRRGHNKNAYEVIVTLDPKKKGGSITLDPIYFKQSLAEIKPSSIKQLERLRDVLRKYPNIFVRIEGHTDNQGPKRALEKLSRMRASTIKNYLIKQGINRSRVQAAGIGSNKPIADNKTLEGRSKNRRVEVVITRILGE